MYQRYARYLLAAASGKRGNYIAFFPSYRFMEAVYEEFQKLLEEEKEKPGIECVMQSQYMTEEAREIFLENFEEARDQSLMGFCVMGGIFAEGIDLARDRLIGAVIVGTGLPGHRSCPGPADRRGDRGHRTSPGVPGAGTSERVL